MKVLESGVEYELGNGQKITFMRRTPADVIAHGTTNEELLCVLIDRLTIQHLKNGCRENIEAIRHLKQANIWLDHRQRSKGKEACAVH
jgi:hypothetical protein